MAAEDGSGQQLADEYAESKRDEDGLLPEGWRLITNGGRKFYYHTLTDVSQWRRPTGPPPAQDPLPDGWEQVTDGDDVFYYHAESDTSTWDRPHAPAAGLPPDWRRCYDKDGDIFYHNTVTGESTWELPASSPATATTAPTTSTTTTSAPKPTTASAPAPAPAAAPSVPAAASATDAVGESPPAVPAVSAAEAARRQKAADARKVAVAAIARAERKSKSKLAGLLGGKGGAGKGKSRRSSWRLLRAMVKTRMALNQHLSKAKRRRLRRGVFASTPESTEAEELRGDPPTTDASLAAIATAMRHFLFKSLPQHQRDAVVTGMRSRTAAVGDTIITQGDTDSNVYVLEAGEVEFVIDGKQVGTTSSTGALFGELALLYDAPRAATAKATKVCHLWMLSAATFRRLARQAAHEEHNAQKLLLRGVPTLMELCDSGAGVGAEPDEVLGAMASELTEAKHGPNEVIIAADGVLDGTYVVKSGTVLGSLGRELSPGDFFGVASFLGDAPPTYEEMKAGPDGAVLYVLHRAALRSVVASIKQRKQLEMEADSKSEDVPRIELSEVEEVGPLGEGSFGVVKMVRWKGRVVALKALNKFHVAQARQVRHVIRERQLLGSVRHPFVVNLQATAVDDNKLYMLLELVQGGELWSLIYNESSPLTSGEGGMPDKAAMFYAANIITGLQFLHEQGIAFRDLKPENLLVNSNGYLKFVDFGFAKRIPFVEDGTLNTKSGTMLGSPDYLAPELILRNGHDHTVDLWALGVIVYEMLAGAPAFDEENRNKGYERACRGDVQFADDMVKRSPMGCDLVKALLVTDPHGRIGDGPKGMATLKAHPWFQDLDWDALAAQTLPAPHVPSIRGVDDRSNFEVDEEEEEEEEDKADMDAPFRGDQSIWADF